MAKQMLCFKHVMCGIIVAFLFQVIHAQSSLDCDFDKGFCDWEQDETDDVNWKRVRIDSGEFVIIVDDTDTGNGQKARLISKWQRPGHNCLTFFYGMYGNTQGDFNMFMSYTGEREKHIFTSARTNNLNWRKRAVISLYSSLEYKVVIEGSKGNGNLSSVVLDDIIMDRGLCTDCNFDSNFCYWTNDVKNGFIWTLLNSQDGPTEDHTTGSGQYVHTGPSRWNTGGTAMLVGPEQSAGKYCFSFWYYMSRQQVDVLRVLAVDGQPMPREIRKVMGSNGQRWIYQKDIVQSNESFKIAFERRFTSGKGETAIDDVLLLSCQDCGDPSPEHGRANTTTFQYGSKVEIACDKGYNLTGSPLIQCQANGVWSNIPNCDPFEEERSSLIAIYVLVPVIIVASVIVITIVFLRKRHPKCMKAMNSTNKSITTHNMPYFNETYNGETPQGQILTNMSHADKTNQSTEEYAIITDCSNDSVKYSNNGSSKNGDKHDYDHTINAPKSFEETTYSHISGNRSNLTDESSYDTTLDLKSRAQLPDSKNKENCYNVINFTDNIKTAKYQANKLIEEPDYDHANAGGPDPTLEDFDDYSHINERKRNANTPNTKSTTGYEPQDRQTPKYTAEKEKEIDEDKPCFMFEGEEISCGSCKKEHHTYFVLEKSEK